MKKSCRLQRIAAARRQLRAAKLKAIQEGKVIPMYEQCELTGMHYLVRPEK